MDEVLNFPAAVAGIILAGGQASRLGGGDKGCLPLAGRPLLDHMLPVLRPQLSRLALNANGDAGRFAAWDLPVLADLLVGAGDYGYGPLVGLLVGLEWAAREGFSWLLSVPSDTPFLPTDLVIRLGLAVHGAEAAVARSGCRDHPVIGLWSTRLAQPLRRFLLTDGQRKVSLWADRCGAVKVPWPVMERDPFFNLNTPQDQTLAEQSVAAGDRSLSRTGVVMVPPGKDVQSLLANLAAALQQRGLRVGGMLQQGDKEQGGVMMRELETGRLFPILQRLGRTASCAADTQAMAEVAVALRRCIEQRPDLLLVNKFAALEAAGGGLYDEILLAMSEEVPLLITVSPRHAENWLACCGGCCELLPPVPSALSAWASRICRPTPPF